MALSMTGFGAAEGDVAGRRLRVEIRTVNHRFFNLAARLPAELSACETDVRDALRKQFDRGHVAVQVRWDDDAPAVAAIDFDRADAVVRALKALQDRFDLGGDVTVELVARQADVFGVRRGDDVVVPWSALEPVMHAAAGECRVLRAREGQALSAEILLRLNALEVSAATIASLAPGRLVRERERLSANVRLLVDDRAIDESRLAGEIALMADRIDITEELVRFRSHVAAARDAVGRDAPVGKQLGFLAQELGREVNTIGAKANDSLIAHEVIAMKGELEKIREQLENLE